MTRILHLSDPHFGTENPTVVRALERWIADAELDLIALTGDITQRARDGQFQAARAFLDRLPPFPKLVIPGNHDLPLYNLFQRFVRPYANYDAAFPEREGVWSDGSTVVVGFDTTTRFRHARGELPDDRLEQGLARAFETRPEFLIACIHQPLDTALSDDREAQYLLVRSEHTARRFAENRVDLVLSGHVHVPLIATTRTAFPELPHHFVLGGAGTAVSTRVRNGVPNSFNLVETFRDEGLRRMRLLEFQFDLDQDGFVEHFRREFVEGASGWSAEP